MKNTNFNLKINPLSKVRIIWNLTKICGWDCDFCCVDAFHISQCKRNVIIRTRCLSQTFSIKSFAKMNTYEVANKFLIKKKLEIPLFEKLNILNNIDLRSEIDFSGGDPLLLKDNMIVIERASQKFGKDNISITATGIGFSKIDPETLTNIVGNIDFTYDSPEKENAPYRPDSYNTTNLKKAGQLKKKGIRMTAQIPLTKENISPITIEKIFTNLHSYNIDNILLMKFIPVGRGSKINVPIPSINEYKVAIEKFKSLEERYAYPVIKIQTALHKFINESSQINTDYASLHCVITQLGILSNSPWAYNEFGEPLEEYIIGDLKEKNISELLNVTLKKEKTYKYWLYYLTNKAASILY